VIDEKVLVKQLQDKKTQNKAFKELIDLYKERLYWHIRKMVISHDDTDDVLQNTFIKIFRNIGSFKGNSKLYSWIYRIATNEAITHINKKAIMQRIDSDEIRQRMVENLEADVYFEGDEIQLKLQKALVRLPQKQQLVFNMRYFDEMKYEDISDILETSVGGLKASYHHARKKIETYLKEESL